MKRQLYKIKIYGNDSIIPVETYNSYSRNAKEAAKIAQAERGNVQAVLISREYYSRKHSRTLTEYITGVTLNEKGKFEYNSGRI